MQKQWRLVDFGIEGDAIRHVGLTKVVSSFIKRGEVPSTVFMCGNSGFRVTVGVQEDIDSVIDLQKARELGIDVARREEGGGTIWAPPHPAIGIIVHYVLGKKDIPTIEDAANLYIKVAEETAKELGMKNVEVLGSGDIRYQGMRKLGSSTVDLLENAYTLNDGFFIFTTSKMRFDLYLDIARIPAAKFKDKAIKDLTQYMAGAWEAAGREITYDEAKQAFKKSIEKHANVKLIEGSLTPNEREEIDEAIRIHRSEPWLLRKSSSKFKAKNEGYKIGFAEEKYKKLVQFNVAVNPKTKELKDIMITGDIYISPWETIDDMEGALKGANVADKELLLKRIKEVLLRPEIETAEIHKVTPEEYCSALEKAIDVALQS